jgi:hypothetical protein
MRMLLGQRMRFLPDVQWLRLLVEPLRLLQERLMRGELPLRVVESDGGFVIRCLCGAEAALVRPAVTQMAGLRASVKTHPRITPDLSPAAVLRMVAHARTCSRIANRESGYDGRGPT